jgi:hypothetical protein
MGQIAISITKTTPFRLGIQPFTNTYHYGSAGLNPSATAADALIDELVALEKTWHSTLVTFTLGRCWSSGGSIAANQMITERPLSGTGATAAGTTIDPERAILAQWPAGLDSRGRRVYLRKWYHPCGNFIGLTIANNHITQQVAFTQTQRDNMAASVDGVTRLGNPEVWGLVAESGRQRDGGILSSEPPIMHPWFEHHQMGEAWRG